MTTSIFFHASGGLAAAGYLAELQFVQIFGSDFFSGSYVSQRVQKEPTVCDQQIGVGLARVIDVLSAVAAPAAINRPFSVDVADTFLARRALPERGLGERDSFADVFSDPLVPAEPGGGETSLTVDPGFCDPESRREFLIHL